MNKELFEKFNEGILRLPQGQIDFGKLKWNKHQKPHSRNSAGNPRGYCGQRKVHQRRQVP